MSPNRRAFRPPRTKGATVTTASYPQPSAHRHHLLHRRHAATERVARQRTFSVSLTLVGLVAVLVSAWGALVPFLGPAIGFGADGSDSWHWNLAHSLLGLVPGAVGIVVGLS